jgi:hypothetical protein
VHFDELEPSFGRVLVVALVLFSMLCFSRELERVGTALTERKDR